MSPIVHGSRAVRRCTACMVSELLKFEDIEFCLLYFDYKYQTEKYLRPLADRVKERVIPVPHKLLVPAWKWFSLPYLEMISPRCDLLYTNESFFPPTKNALVLATIHGLHHKVIPEKIPSQNAQLLHQGISFISKHADYMVAVSETTKEELITYAGVPPERIYVITHGVDPEFFRLENRPEVWERIEEIYGLNRPYVLYVGAIALHKNIMGVLSAYERSSIKLSHNLVLAGPPDSAWERAHRFVTERNLSGRVHFLGHVYETRNLCDLYNGADVFVFPSFYEAWTSPPLEAMACGTPVITSDCSSLPETVGDAAIQIDPNNPEELAYEMKRVLSDQSLRNDLIKKGVEHAALHTWEKAAAKLIEVFADIRSRGPWKGQRE